MLACLRFLKGRCLHITTPLYEGDVSNRPSVHTAVGRWQTTTVRAEIFAVVLFSRISRVKPSRKFRLQFMSIYSNDNISKIAKLTTRELPHLAKTAKITVRENFSSYSILCIHLYFKITQHTWTGRWQTTILCKECYM